MSDTVARVHFAGIRKSSRLFAERVGQKVLLSDPPPSSALFSLRGMKRGDYLSLADLSITLALVRRLAESGTRVEIEWPRSGRGGPSRMQKVVEGLRVSALFGDGTRGGQWASNVKILGRKAPSRSWRFDPGTAHFIPARWFDVGSFGERKGPHLWKTRPLVPTELAKDLRDMLVIQRFSDEIAVDILLDVVFMEFGWNVVLHAGPKPGDGVGLFCGQVQHPTPANGLKQPRVVFCVVDAGRGIPSALGPRYAQLPESSPQRYHEHLGICKESGIVRFALDRGSTSRPGHISHTDAIGCRGLAYVVDSLEGRGELSLRSYGGLVSVSYGPAGPERMPTNELNGCPMPGTQAIGVIAARRKAKPSSLPGSVGITRIPALIRVSDLRGNAPTADTPEGVSELLARVPIHDASVVILDMGFAELYIRSLNYLCKAIVKLGTGSVVVLWNLRNEWTSLQSVVEYLRETQKGGRQHVLIIAVRAWNDAMALGQSFEQSRRLARMLSNRCPWLSPSPRQLEEPSLLRIGIPLQVDPSDYLALCRMINTQMLQDGFASELQNEGYFAGVIHLLSGEDVRRYFSFSENVASGSANLQRWVVAAYAAFRLAIPERPSADSRLVVLGFTTTAYPLVARLCEDIDEVSAGYVIRSFDVPSIEEIRQVVRSGDAVVLITDVVSTGTSTRSLVDLVEKAGAKAVALLAAVDARRGPALGSQSEDVDSGKLPVFSCAELDVRDVGQSELPFREYWVDPVSLVPKETRPRISRLPDDLSERIQQTLDAVCGTKAARCGHRVDGTRHMSVYVDVRILLERAQEAMSEYLQESIPDRLSKRGWSDFSPSCIVFPSGVARIEPVRIERGKTGEESLADVVVYATAVRTYVKLLRRLWPSCQQAEVMRVFDPGGHSRCADVEETLRALGANGTDIVVADDGMWTGRTVMSLLQSAIEAGAKRILIIPLLARLPLNESLQWESINSLAGRSGRTSIPVCIFFPLVYPVPAYGAQDCPYELTRRRLEEKTAGLPDLDEVVVDLLSTIKAATPGESDHHGETFTDTWVRLRCYLELAAGSEAGMEAAKDVLRRATDADRQSAVFELFLGEWQILSRARIRQSLKPQVEKLAVDCVKDLGTASAVRLAAASLLRSVFPSTYVRILDSVVQLAIQHPKLQERLLLHVLTLETRLKTQPACRTFLERLAEVVMTSGVEGTDEPTRRDVRLATAARTELLTMREGAAVQLATDISPVACANHLRRMISEDGDVQHNLRGTLVSLYRGRSNLHLNTAEVWAFVHENWRDTLEPLLCDSFLPYVGRLRLALVSAATGRSAFAGHQVQYLVGKVSSLDTLAHDISSLVGCLSVLSREHKLTNRGRFVDAVAECARRLWQALCGTRTAFEAASSSEEVIDPEALGDLCTLGALLVTLRRWRIAVFVERLRAEVEFVLKSSGASREVKLINEGPPATDSYIFLPDHLARRAIAHVTSNLADYAFPAGSEWCKNAGAEVTVGAHRNENDDGILKITVRDRGAPINGRPQHKLAGLQLHSDMETFGGSYPVPRGSSLAGWTAEQYIHVMTW